MEDSKRQENLKIHSVRHILEKIHRNIPNEEFRRKIISASLVINTTLFEPHPELKKEINDVYELVLYNKRVDDIIVQLDEGIQKASNNYEQARRDLSAKLAATQHEEAMERIPFPSDSPFYPSLLAYFKPALSHSYQFGIRLVQLGKRIEGVIHSEENSREQKWYFPPHQFNRLPMERRDLYDKLIRDRRDLEKALQSLQ